MPIEDLPLNEVTVSLHHLRMGGDDQDDEPEEVVVIVKRTKTVFEAHKEEYYRDKGSRKHNYQNEFTLRPKDQDLKRFW